jgi:hypothetical protein
MLAVIALIIFVLALFDVAIGSINMTILGLAFIAAHLAFGVPIQFWRPRGTSPS